MNQWNTEPGALSPAPCVRFRCSHSRALFQFSLFLPNAGSTQLFRICYDSLIVHDLQLTFPTFRFFDNEYATFFVASLYSHSGFAHAAIDFYRCLSRIRHVPDDGGSPRIDNRRFVFQRKPHVLGGFLAIPRIPSRSRRMVRLLLTRYDSARLFLPCRCRLAIFSRLADCQRTIPPLYDTSRFWTSTHLDISRYFPPLDEVDTNKLDV